MWVLDGRGHGNPSLSRTGRPGVRFWAKGNLRPEIPVQTICDWLTTKLPIRWRSSGLMRVPAVGSLINLRFSLGEAEKIELRGLVRHRVHGCGVEFVEVLPDQQMRLIAYLDSFNLRSAS